MIHRDAVEKREAKKVRLIRKEATKKAKKVAALLKKKYKATRVILRRCGKITLVMDNLNTHTPGSLYETFPPDKAKALWDRFNFVYTPKHGSWLNMAEIELNVLTGQCLNRKIDNIEKVKKEAQAWLEHRNNKNAKVNWQFTTEDARIKLSRLYPTIES